MISEKIASRVRIMRMWTIFHPEKTEVAFTRNQAEATGVGRLLAAMQSQMFRDCNKFDHRFLFGPLTVSDKFSPLGPGGQSVDTRQHRGSRKREHYWRHQFGYLIPGHCLEVQMMHARVAGKFPQCGDLFGTVEVSYMFWPRLDQWSFSRVSKWQIS